jgi:hypothetical protein
MAKSFPNIDKSAFRRGKYVGYSAGGKVWKITKANPNGSRAKWLAQTGRQFFYAETLAEISEKLASFSDAAIDLIAEVDGILSVCDWKTN